MVIQALRQKLFARWYDRMMAAYEGQLRERKRALFSELRGSVVELGPGTGVNLSLLPAGVTWTGIEPNEFMHVQLRAKARELGLEIDLRTMSAGALPFEDASVDAVIETLVMCSVPDVAAALREVRRVLKPGGRFVFWEHVIAPSGRMRRGFQHAITPLQSFIGDGCRCNRDFAASVRAAGFDDVQLEEFEAPREAAPAWVRPHVCGVATAR